MERGGRGTFSLLVGGVSEEDLGCYTCQATNEAGSRQVTVEILLEGTSSYFTLTSESKITETNRDDLMTGEYLRVLKQKKFLLSVVAFQLT